MVFFTCSACGASLKKNQVEKHFNHKCRHCEYLTCIDCLKDFPGDTYKAHTKCITENERYGGKNYVPKVNKNENKQLQWVENIQNLLKTNVSLDPDIKDLLETILHFENIPRKKTKFINFVKNVNKRVHPKTVEKTWEFFEKALKQKKTEPKSSPVKNDQNKENSLVEKEDVKEETKDTKSKKKKKGSKGKDSEKSEVKEDPQKEKSQKGGFLPEFKGTAFHESTKKMSNKRKHTEEEEEETSQPRKVGKFDWEGVITSVLEKKDGSVSLKKLKKKILAEYESQCGVTHKTQEDLLSKMNKKLQKNKKFKVQKDHVILVN